MKTINSIRSQTGCDFEFIVIDGGSVDGSRETIRENEAIISNFVSEEDGGIYEAMNKGIGLASGEYCLFMNSGDIFPTATTLEEVRGEISGEDLIYGDIYLDTKEGWKEYRYTDRLDTRYILKYVIPHQASYIRKELFSRVGLYNTGFRIVSDWEWTVRLVAFHPFSYRHIDRFIAVYDTGGLSFNGKNEALIREERERALKALFTPEQLAAFDSEESGALGLRHWLKRKIMNR